MTIGTCLCGAVRLTLPFAPCAVDVCHCAICRKIASGAPQFAIECHEAPVVEGAEHVGLYRSSEWAERAFCTRCGSSLYYRLLDRDFYTVSAGLFDAATLELTKQIFIDEKPAFYDFANDTPRLTGAEVIAAYTATSET